MSLHRKAQPVLRFVSNRLKSKFFVTHILVSLPSQRYELAFALAAWLYLLLALVCPLLLKKKGTISALGIIALTIISFGIVVIIVTLGPLGRAIPSVCA